MYTIILLISFNQAFSQCTHNGTYTWPTQQVTWTANVIDKDITINSGYELILDRTYYVAPGVNIIVNCGGRLTITNADISVDQSCNTKFWDGIVVNGDDGNQFVMSGSQKNINFADFGYVYIRNSVIKHMDGGIILADGGIIDAKGSTFANNRISFHFSSYYPIAPPSGWPSGQVVYNASKIEECYFYWDNWLVDFDGDGYSDQDYTDYTHIKVWDDQRVYFGGNYFYNWDANNFSGTGRGIGIEASANSTFAVVKSNITGFENHCPQYGTPSRVSKFGHLSKGINFEGNTADENSRFGLHSSYFYHNRISIEASDGYKNLITECNFDFIEDSSRFSGLSTSIRPLFIKATGGDFWVMYKNIFTSDMNYLNYIKVINSGNTSHFNSIRSCSLSNSNSSNSCYGVVVEDDCSDLRIKCNYFNDIDIDWYIESGATLGQQGVSGWSHGNIFSNQTANIENNGNYFTIFYEDLSIGDKPVDVLTNINYISGHTRTCNNVDCDQVFSIPENDKNTYVKFEVYPNPTKDYLYLLDRKLMPTNLNYSIYNNLGQKVQSGTTEENGLTEIQLAEKKPGLYLIVIRINDIQTYSLQFMIF